MTNWLNNRMRMVNPDKIAEQGLASGSFNPFLPTHVSCA